MKMSVERWWNDTDRGKLKYWEKTLWQCYSCTTQLTLIEQGSNPGLLGERPPNVYIFSSHGEYRQSASVISTICFTVTK